jgi:nucleoid DNA-binding protein
METTTHKETKTRQVKSKESLFFKCGNELKEKVDSHTNPRIGRNG